MKKITVDARMLHHSGIGTVIENVLSRLIAVRSDWQFNLLGNSKELEAFAQANNVRYVSYDASIYSIAEQIDWPAAAVRGSDLYWCPHYNIPLRCRQPLLVTVHDVSHLALKDIFSSASKRLYAHLMLSRVRLKADVVAFDSQFSRDEFHRLVGPMKTDREEVILLGVDDFWFSDKARGEPSRPYILFVGNIKRHKNLVRLLEAFRSVSDQIPHDLYIVGRKEGFLTGDDRVSEVAAVLGDRVRFTGRIADAELREYYGQACALILPSLYEGFGLPPLEAMASGCPVLVSRAASLPEVVADAGCYFDPLDTADIAATLVRVVRDTSLRDILRKKGLQRARSLSWDATVASYVALMEDILAGRRQERQNLQPISTL